MKLAVRKTTTVITALATAGVSSIFMGATPAFAATDACGVTGDLIQPGICEVTFTAGASVFTPTSDMTQLEVLLVGAGGASADQNDGQGYSAPGGGGEVKIVDFSGATSPLTLTVPSFGTPGSVTDGTTTGSVNNGADAVTNTQFGATSGSGFPGGIGGGGGAGASPTASEDGGAGVTVSSIAPVGSLFSTDSNCYGGGGAGIITTNPGIPGCGGGGATDGTGTALFAPTANSGGGGGGLAVTQTLAQRMGADGLVVVRWTATSVLLDFNMLGHGTAPVSQTIQPGLSGTQPADPTATGYTFNGWFTDSALSTPANFATPITEATTFYASWTAAPATVYTVTFNSNGHGTTPADQTITSGSPAAQPANPTATGYTFNGWYTDAALTTPANFATPITGATTFYASWTVIPAAVYTVTFDTNGHGTAPADQTVTSGSPALQPSALTASGYTFNGWYTDAALTTPVNFATPIAGATTLYASWTAVPVTPAATAPVLAATGSVPNSTVLPIGFAMLLAGAGFFTVALRRKRRNG